MVVVGTRGWLSSTVGCKAYLFSVAACAFACVCVDLHLACVLFFRYRLELYIYLLHATMVLFL